MLTAYSTNQTVAAGASIPLNNIVVETGCSTKLVAPSTIKLNRSGVYSVTANAASTTAAPIALSYNGITMTNTVMPAGESTSFKTYIPAFGENNTCRCGFTPALLQVINPSDAEATYTVINVSVKKES